MTRLAMARTTTLGETTIPPCRRISPGDWDPSAGRCCRCVTRDARGDGGRTMSETIRTECPYCHHRGTLSREVERGREIRCVSCRQVFEYQPSPRPPRAELR